MGFIFKLLAKAAKVDATDILNQQTVTDLLHIVKEVVL